MAEIRISNEHDAFKVLAEAAQSKFRDKDISIVFDKWPILTLKYEGEGFDSSISPQIMEGLLDLQRALNRAFAELIGQQPNAAHLRDIDRKDIELLPRVTAGSSEIKIDYTKVLEKFVTKLAGKMTGEQLLYAVIGLAFVTGSTLVAKDYVAGRSKGMKQRLRAPNGFRCRRKRLNA